ncbi:opine metallophore biosynthesis dehydrogenase [Serratia marcescens]|uniref:opine metallophore biosynthesis dehydrogenase n=1 Tax=Serratia nevei TaxID=2703794 RepID=UPI0018D7C925|nr:opine metallophore biosynthesis dehydrogenase [Serratia marcescens]MBH2805767.1 opine metallophore biosynthesis dehydrogenase [Serratia marcescens]MBN5233216.1 opine metallophore biosynthesis dehydrogenase [Serratia marcescens]
MNNAFPTLILGAGPAAIQLAADIQAAADTRIGLYNRPSEKGQRLKAYLAHTPSLHLEGVGKARQTQRDAQVAVDSYCDDLSLIGGDWQRLILAVPADRYYEVLRQVPWATLPHLRSLILLSPSIGSGLMVQNLLQAAGQSHVGIISLSSYYADTKYQDAAQPYRAYTKAFKQRIYLAAQSPTPNSAELDWIGSVLARHAIDARCCDSLLAAERFSITNYVHPPLALADTTLQAIFQPQAPVQYLYKTYPEGPLCPEVIADMLELSEDYKRLLNHLGVEEINLLRFLNDDSYPVPSCMVSRRWIDHFPQLAPAEQRYALFTRYTALLVDPYSEPDALGRYYDFSAVRVARVFQDAQGLWCLPRVPLEDVRKLRTLVLLAERLGVEMPTARRLLARFQQALQSFVTLIGAEHCHHSLLDDTCDEQAAITYRQWRGQA